MTSRIACAHQDSQANSDAACTSAAGRRAAHTDLCWPASASAFASREHSRSGRSGRGGCSGRGELAGRFVLLAVVEVVPW
eukprot:12882646-Heterocapsa_arctica.AAC.1